MKKNNSAILNREKWRWRRKKKKKKKKKKGTGKNVAEWNRGFEKLERLKVWLKKLLRQKVKETKQRVI